MGKNLFDKRRTYTAVVDCAVIAVGAVLMGVALSVFMVPFKIAPGGVSGLATVLHYLAGLRVSVLIPIINIPIFIIGIIRLERDFLVKSVFGTVVLSIATETAAILPPPTSDPLISAVFGGAVMGIGISAVLSRGGTTGGTDILVLVIRRSFSEVSVGRLYLLIDGAVIAMAGFAFSSGEVIFYSAVSLVVSTYMTDAALEGLNLARLVYIISDSNREICDRIYAELKRGVTGLNSVSMYSGRSGRILMCVIRKGQLSKLKKIIQDIDKDAFVIICDAKEVMGSGFEMRRI
ncbi:MAG: YitT family protein [Eubacteriales bacterium]|nr:YitT family protein [Eubacteriales bacterium]